MEEILKELFEICEVSSIDELLADFNIGVEKDSKDYLTLDHIIEIYLHAKESGDKHNEIGL